MALFVGCYHSVWFLQCAVASAAPYNTLMCFDNMLKFTEFDLHLGFSVLDSILRHTWFLTEQLVVLSLTDEDCPEQERKALAQALAITERPESFSPGKPDLPIDFLPEDGQLPSLAYFVGP